MNHSDKLGLLLLKLENLQVRQEGFGAEIKALKVEIRNIQSLLSADADSIQQLSPPNSSNDLSIGLAFSTVFFPGFLCQQPGLQNQQRRKL